MDIKTLLIIYGSLVVVLSLLEIFLYFKDKSLAKKNSQKRIKEKTLLLVSALGGALGAIIGGNLAHHKTSSDKMHFHLVNGVSLILSIGLIVFMILKMEIVL